MTLEACRRPARIASVAVLVASLCWSLPAAAQIVLPCGGRDLFQVQNVGDATADVTVTYYNQNGSMAGEQNTVVPLNASETFNPPTNAFLGSCAVTSDQPIVAVAQMNLPGNGSGTGYQYAGMAPFVPPDPDSFTVAFPLTQDGQLTILNRDPLLDNALQIFGTDSRGTLQPSTQFTLPPSGSARRTPADLGLSGTGPFTHDIFCTTQPIVAVVNILGNNRDIDSVPASGPDEFDALFPYLKTPIPGASQQLQVQNVSFSNANVTIEYFDSNGKKAGTSMTSLSPREFRGVEFPWGTDAFDGSAVVTSDAPILGLVNVQNVGSGSRAATYQTTIPGFTDDQVTRKRSWAIGPADPLRTGLTYRMVNVGKGKAKVVVTIRDGDGNVVRTRKLKARRNGFAELEMPAAVVSGAFSIETLVKRKGPVIPMALEERQDGEINFVPSLQPTGS